MATFLSMQAVLYFQADSVAKSAAQQGARQAARENSSAGAGQALAQQFAASSAIQPQAVDVQVSRGATQASATVRIHAQSLIPGIKLVATETATAPVERVRQ